MDEFDLQAEIGKGWRFNSPRAGYWEAVSPSGRLGTGETPEEAVANVDAVILPSPTRDSKFLVEVIPGTNRFYTGRVLVRSTGEEVALDKWHFIPVPGDANYVEPPAPVNEDSTNPEATE